MTHRNQGSFGRGELKILHVSTGLGGIFGIFSLPFRRWKILLSGLGKRDMSGDSKPGASSRSMLPNILAMPRWNHHPWKCSKDVYI